MHLSLSTFQCKFFSPDYCLMQTFHPTFFYLIIYLFRDLIYILKSQAHQD